LFNLQKLDIKRFGMVLDKLDQTSPLGNIIEDKDGYHMEMLLL
jgi:hypothetical protein